MNISFNFSILVSYTNIESTFQNKKFKVNAGMSCDVENEE